VQHFRIKALSPRRSLHFAHAKESRVNRRRGARFHELMMRLVFDKLGRPRVSFGGLDMTGLKRRCTSLPVTLRLQSKARNLFESFRRHRFIFFSNSDIRIGRNRKEL
jgi:hypothetical protein